MKRKTREQMVIEIYDREAMGEVTAREIAIITQGLIAEFGEGGALSPGQIAHVLLQEDLPIRFDHVLRMMGPTEKYENIFYDLQEPDSLAEAEDAIRQIDEWWRKFQRVGDRTGARFALEAAREARRRALEKAAEPRLPDRQRAVQAELAEWMLVWLQTPALFPQWLELRKGAPDFREKFGELPSAAAAQPAAPETSSVGELGKTGTQ